MEDAVARLEAALMGLDPGHALYVIALKLMGKNPVKELPVCDQETGQVLAYLVPAGQRHATVAAARPSQNAVDSRDRALTLKELVVKYGS